MRSLKYVASVALTLTASSLAGCAGEDLPGAGVLVVPFELGNQRTCDELGIVAVRGELGDDGDLFEEVECEAGELRFTHLNPGRYNVTLYGLNEDDVPVMDSLVSGPQTIQVVGDTTVVFDPPLGLTSAPARLQLRWTFGFSTCESASIDGFSIAAWRADGSALLMESEVACGMAGEGREQYRTVPDLDRELSGSEVGEVEVQPHDSQGFAIGDPITFKFKTPGPGAQIKLSLDCNEGGCDGTGTPD